MLARERDEPGETGYPRFSGDTAPFARVQPRMNMKRRDSKTGRNRRGIKKREKNRGRSKLLTLLIVLFLLSIVIRKKKT